MNKIYYKNKKELLDQLLNYVDLNDKRAFSTMLKNYTYSDLKQIAFTHSIKIERYKK